MVRADSGLLLARGNVRTCEAVGFLFGFHLGGYVYNCFLSIYYLMCIRYNKKEAQLTKIMEPYVHILSLGIPIGIGTAAFFTENFNTLLSMSACDVTAEYPAACGFRDDVECERGGTLGWSVVATARTVLSILFPLVGGVCTWLIYWTTRQKLRASTRFSYSIAPSLSIAESLTPQQRKILRTVTVQAILYFFSFFIGFAAVIITTIVNQIVTTDIDDVKELSGKPGLTLSVILVAVFFPLNGFLNMLVWMRPRIVQWRETHSDRSWFWAYRQVLAGTSAPISRTTNDNHINDQRRGQWLNSVSYNTDMVEPETKMDSDPPTEGKSIENDGQGTTPNDENCPPDEDE